MIIENLQSLNLKANINTILLIGNFDGVHRGHKKLIELALKIKEQENLPIILLTFEPHPLEFFGIKKNDFRILNFKQKEVILKDNGNIDYLVKADFNEEFASLNALDFFEKIIINKLKTKHIIIGHDFIFGAKRSGNAEFLKQKCADKNINLHQLDVQTTKNCKVTFSSSKIREALKNADIKLANKLLGYKFFIENISKKGMQLARELGFPTINVPLKNDIFIKPKNGVYACNCYIENKKFKAIANIGKKPTIKNSEDIFLEIHILDNDINLEDNLYNINVKTEFLEHIRDEVKFASVNDLKEQIAKDCKIAREIHEKL